MVEENKDQSEIPDFLKGDEPNEEIYEAEEVETQLVENPTDPIEQDEDEAIDDEFSDPSFVGRVRMLMNELNLGKKQIVFILIFLGGLIFAIIFSFRILFSFLGSNPDEIDVQNESDPVQVEEEKEGFFSRIFGGNDDNNNVDVDVDVDVERDSTTVTPAKELGQNFDVDFESQSIRTILRLGEAEIVEDRLGYYVRTYRKLRNIFNTDLFSYLDVVEDREESFNAYLIQFKGANEQLKLAHNDLLTEIASFKTRLENVQNDAALVEEEFFVALDELDSERIPELLDAFQDASTKRDIVKSELKAREAILAKYSKAMSVIEDRITAIELNSDAFIKGVKVIDYEQVDLDLVIQARE